MKEQHTCILSADVRLTIPKSIKDRMDLKKDDYVIVIEKEFYFEVYKAKIEPITHAGDVIVT